MLAFTVVHFFYLLVCVLSFPHPSPNEIVPLPTVSEDGKIK